MYTKEGFSKRLLNLRKESGVSRQNAADSLEISRASLEYYEKGLRLPDAYVLAKIANYYDVSADYLLGRTEAATTDIDLQTICDYVNLTEKAVENISEFTSIYPPFNMINAGTVFKDLCENGSIFSFCQYIVSYFEISDLISLYEKMIAKKKHNNQDYSEYEELLKAAKSDCDYFKWQINNYVNQISDYIVEIYKDDLNDETHIESDIHWYGDMEKILKHHMRVQTNLLYFFSGDGAIKENTNNDSNTPKEK